MEQLYNLRNFYVHLGRFDKAEKMYQHALESCEKAWGLEHIEILDTFNKLDTLCKDSGMLDEWEKMN